MPQPEPFARLRRTRVILTALVVSVVVAGSPTVPTAQTTTADTVVVNGHVLTVDARFTIAEAVAVKDGRVVAVGSNAAVRRFAGPATRVIDAKGRTVIPGLADNHLHNAGGGPGMDLSKARSVGDVLAQVRQRVLAAEPGELLVSNGDWHEAQLKEQVLPLRRDLDRVAPMNPVVLVRGGHEYVLNSAALARWKIDENTGNVAGGKISRYEDGTLNGELVDRARGLITLPPPPARNLEQRMAAQAAEYQKLNAAGLTSVRHPGISVDEYRMLQEMQRRGMLKMRVSALLRPGGNLDAPDVTKFLESSGLHDGEGDEWLRVGGIKLGVDGGFEGGFMRTPYDEPWGEHGTFRGLQTVPADRYTAIVRAVNRAGWRVATHAVGDAAIDQVLDAYEAADRDRSIGDKRWAVEHAFIAHPEHLARMRALGVAVSAQDHLYLAGPTLLKYWGEARVKAMTPMRSFIDAGLHVSSGTDSGVIPYPPLWTLYHFVTRDTLSGGVIGPEQRISRQEALRAATTGTAWLTFDETRKGSLEVGKLADLVVLSNDIMNGPAKTIESARVLLTMVGGEVVFADSGFLAASGTR